MGKASIIKVEQNEKGEIYITLYGTKYQIVVEKDTEKPNNAKKSK